MDVDAVVSDEDGETPRQENIESADWPQAIVVGAKRGAGIGCDGQSGFAVQVLAESEVERLAVRRADAIRAGPEHQSGTSSGLSQRQKICDDADFTYTRIVFHAGGQPRVKSICQRGPHSRAGNLIGKQADT
jgi:hypothetical protein